MQSDVYFANRFVEHCNDLANFGTTSGIFLQKSCEIDCKAHLTGQNVWSSQILSRSIAISDRTVSVERPLFRAVCKHHTIDPMVLKAHNYK